MLRIKIVLIYLLLMFAKCEMVTKDKDRLVGWVLWHIKLFRLFNEKSIFIQTPVLFRTI